VFGSIPEYLIQQSQWRVCQRKAKMLRLMFGKLFAKFRPRVATDNCFLVLDIGTEFVKVLVCRIEEGHAFITGHARVRQGLGDMAAGAVADIAGVAANCDAAIRQATRMAKLQPEQVVIGIAGELVRGRTTVIDYTRADPKVRIDLGELRAIIQKAQQRSFGEVRSELSRETGHREVDVKLAHAAILDSQIDGQHVTNPLGFQGQDVRLAVFNAFAPLVHFGALQTIAAELELDLLTIAAEPYAVARALTVDSGTDPAAIFIDVGGGTTDIALARGAGELSMRMFALGGRTFTKRLAQAFNVSFLEGERIKIDYSQNKLDARSAALTRKALAGDTEVWLAGVELALSELAGERPLPARILLCGGGSKLPEIKQALESVEWTRSLPFKKRPTVKFVVPEDIVKVTDQTGQVRTVQDVTPLALANLGLELAGEEQLLSILLRKAVKLLQN
jgi:cell division protein FtsA